MKKLLIVDMQCGFISENSESLIKNIENLIKNGNFDQIIATKFVNNGKSQFKKFLDYDKFCDADEQMLCIKLPKDAVILEKTSYALPGDLNKFFSASDDVYLCGTDYDSCVLAICFQLFDFGIQPHVILNCVTSHSHNPIPKEDFRKICIKNFGKNSIIEKE